MPVIKAVETATHLSLSPMIAPAVHAIASATAGRRLRAFPDVAAKLPPTTMEDAERTFRGSLDVDAVVRGATVPTYEELQTIVADEDPLM